MISIPMRDNTGHRIARFAVGTALALLIPAIAMQFTDEVVWTLSDFVVAGSLLFGSSLIYVVGTRKIRSTKSRLVVGLIVAAVLLVVWAELAVGVFGTPFAGS
jgi:hypothetical protein